MLAILGKRKEDREGWRKRKGECSKRNTVECIYLNRNAVSAAYLWD